jgi:hypothetical protein
MARRCRTVDGRGVGANGAGLQGEVDEGRARVVLVGRETNADGLGNERRSEEKDHWDNRRYTAAEMQE